MSIKCQKTFAGAQRDIYTLHVLSDQQSQIQRFKIMHNKEKQQMFGIFA